jgi:hypothetical protein
MEGGIAILLLVIIVAVAFVVGIAMYFTGGALWFGRTGRGGDDLEGERGERFERPEHKEVTSETIENTRLAGTRDDDRR